VVIITKRGASAYELRARKEPQSAADRKKAIRRLGKLLLADVAKRGRIGIHEERWSEILDEEREDRV
jgi:hypothetical protein